MKDKDTGFLAKHCCSLLLWYWWVYRVVLSDDPALAMAFSVARRAAAVPVLLVNGTYRASNRVYLDSLLLQGQLQSLSGFGTNSGYSLVLYFLQVDDMNPSSEFSQVGRVN